MLPFEVIEHKLFIALFFYFQPTVCTISEYLVAIFMMWRPAATREYSDELLLESLLGFVDNKETFLVWLLFHNEQ